MTLAELRAAWRADAPAVDPNRVVFIDETGANTTLERRYGDARSSVPSPTATTSP